jgi:filamentous hemagglutinin family protein
MASKTYISKEEKAKILACVPHVNLKSISRMLNINYANVFNIINKNGIVFENKNPQRKYPYKKKQL